MFSYQTTSTLHYVQWDNILKREAKTFYGGSTNLKTRKFEFSSYLTNKLSTYPTGYYGCFENFWITLSGGTFASIYNAFNFVRVNKSDHRQGVYEGTDSMIFHKNRHVKVIIRLTDI